MTAPAHAPKKGFGYALGMILKNEKMGGRPFFEKIELSPGKEAFGIVETPDGKPATGVRIAAYSRPHSDRFAYGSFDETRTDKDGKFRFILYTPGDAGIWLEPKDHAVTAHILKEKRGDLGKFVLREGVRFKGKLLDVKGKPVPNVYLEIERRGGGDEQISGVADLVRRFTKTNEKGEFAVDPLLPGKYQIVVRNYTVQENRDEGFRRYELPGVFLRQSVEVKAGKMEDVEVRAVPHVWIEAQYLDSKGKPRGGHDITLFGRLDKQSWFGDGEPDAKGKIRFMAPHGLTQARIQLITNEHSSLRHRPGPGKPLSNKTDIELGTLEGDVKGIEIIRYEAPILLVKAVDKEGKAIDKFTVSCYYTGESRRRGSRDLEGTETEIVFEKQDDGRRRSSQLLPDEEFEVTVAAKGYKKQVQRIKLAEGTTKDLTATLEKE